MLRNSFCLTLLLSSTQIMLGQVSASDAAASPVPTIVRFAGSIRDLDGRELSGPRDLTFALYKSQEAGISFWTERQIVVLDTHGRYTAFLGSVTPGGFPPTLFSSGEAQWIGVTPDDGVERPRFALTTVPYAFKAAEADTLGGRKAEDFVSTQQLTALLGSGIANSSIAVPDAAAVSSAWTPSLNTSLPPGSSGSAFTNVRDLLPWGVAPGSNLVSRGMSQPPMYQNKLVLDVRDYGVRCDGSTDDTVAMQTAVNAACNAGARGKTLVLPNSCSVKLTSTLNVTKCSGITLDGGQSQGQTTIGAAGGAGSGNAALLWYGSVGGTVFEINQTRDSKFINFTVFTNARDYSATGANIGILVDENGALTNIVTNNDFEDIQVYNGNARNPNFIGINICPSAPGNCESQNFTRVTMGCGGGAPTSTSNGTGIKYAGGEPFYAYLRWYESTACSKAIDVEAANILDIDGGLASGNYTDLFVNAGRNISYRHTRTEGAIAQIVIGNPSYSGAHDLTVEENSFSGLTNSTTTISYPYSDTGGILRVIKNDWDRNSTVRPFGPTGTGIFVGWFDSQDNNYPNTTLCPVISSTVMHSSLLDQSFNMPACEK